MQPIPRFFGKIGRRRRAQQYDQWMGMASYCIRRIDALRT